MIPLEFINTKTKKRIISSNYEIITLNERKFALFNDNGVECFRALSKCDVCDVKNKDSCYDHKGVEEIIKENLFGKNKKVEIERDYSILD